MEPFRAADCTVEVDGACAVLVTSLERARDLRHPPAVDRLRRLPGRAAPGPRHRRPPAWADYTRNYTSSLRRRPLRAGPASRPATSQLAEIYDCFSSTVLMASRASGCANGAGRARFVRSGGTRLDGALPTNTNGGLLCEGYLHGMNTVAEAALQVQGRGGDRQAPRHDVCVVTSGALMDGSALILTGDR